MPTFASTTVCGNLPDQILGAINIEGGNTFGALCPMTAACCTNGGCVTATEDDCGGFLGQWRPSAADCNAAPCQPPCLADVTGDAEVGANDILQAVEGPL